MIGSEEGSRLTIISPTPGSVRHIPAEEREGSFEVQPDIRRHHGIQMSTSFPHRSASGAMTQSAGKTEHLPRTRLLVSCTSPP